MKSRSPFTVCSVFFLRGTGNQALLLPEETEAPLQRTPQTRSWKSEHLCKDDGMAMAEVTVTLNSGEEI